MRKKAPAKINVFLKVVGKRGNYHELNSRFVVFDELCDVISFEPKKSSCEFELLGDFTCKSEQNTITKAYHILKQSGFEKQMKSFFSSHSVHVEKNIPEFAGLGGGSSDGASFLLLCNEVLGLKLSKEKLASLGAKVGADVPFFVYEYKSANVSGIGERVEEFEDDIPHFKLVTPDVQCSTGAVFTHFSKNFKFSKVHQHWFDCSSKALLENFSSTCLNDLYKSALELYPAMEEFYKQGYFMSGSGSSVFGVKNG